MIFLGISWFLVISSGSMSTNSTNPRLKKILKEKKNPRKSPKQNLNVHLQICQQLFTWHIYVVLGIVSNRKMMLKYMGRCAQAAYMQTHHFREGTWASEDFGIHSSAGSWAPADMEGEGWLYFKSFPCFNFLESVLMISPLAMELVLVCIQLSHIDKRKKTNFLLVRWLWGFPLTMFLCVTQH